MHNLPLLATLVLIVQAAKAAELTRDGRAVAGRQVDLGDGAKWTWSGDVGGVVALSPSGGRRLYAKMGDLIKVKDVQPGEYKVSVYDDNGGTQDLGTFSVLNALYIPVSTQFEAKEDVEYVRRRGEEARRGVLLPVAVSLLLIAVGVSLLIKTRYSVEFGAGVSGLLLVGASWLTVVHAQDQPRSLTINAALLFVYGVVMAVYGFGGRAGKEKTV